MTTIHKHVMERIGNLLRAPLPGEPARDKGAEIRVLEEVLRLAAKHRAHLLQNTLLERMGPMVWGGPFQGMAFVESVTEGCYVPKLLGCYEWELHEYVERAINRGYRHVVNIGCAEGYYAVGFARRMPAARVYAFDTDARGQATCRTLSERNGVGERVEVGGELFVHDFTRFPAGETLVFCDIEGAELDLLDPAEAPALAGFDLIVELHTHVRRDTPEVVLSRFAATHEITRVEHQLGAIQLPPLFDELNLGHLDRLLSVWEWRMTRTPWAVLRSRAYL
jgi:hypothetical protein